MVPCASNALLLRLSPFARLRPLHSPCSVGKSVVAGAGTVEDVCAACDAGKFAAAGAACANCAVGKFSLAEATTCTDCAATAAGTATTVAAGAGKKAGDCAVDAATAKDIADKAKAKAV